MTLPLDSPEVDQADPRIDASAAPVRQSGVRSRAGNAMNRTRSAVITGALAAVETHGARKATMADIASASGIAKGTLYNHFRTKEAVFAAAVDATVAQIAAESVELAATDLATAFVHAATAISSIRALRRLADEPAALIPLLQIGDSVTWTAAAEGVAAALAAADLPVDDLRIRTVLRWLMSFITAPGSAAEAASGAAVLVAGLSRAPDLFGNADTSS